MKIAVGIMTDGMPGIRDVGEYHILSNQLIGRGFHWEQSIETHLPGEIVLTDDPDFPIRNIVDIETYLACVVGSEMSPESPIEFLKAHAIISRSWAVGKALHSHCSDETGKIWSDDEILHWEDTADHHSFDVCSDDHCQRYQGIQPLCTEAITALSSTKGIVLVDNDEHIVDARFSKCCGGRTEIFPTCWQNVNPKCLVSINDPWCDLRGIEHHTRERLIRSVLKDYDRSTSGGHEWTVEISSEEIAQHLKDKFGKNIGMIIDLVPVTRGASGRISRLDVIGTRGRVRIGKELMIRKLLSKSHLYSSWLEIENVSPSGFRLHGRGWGHGVGLCQIGAARMATEGYTADEILRFYYPGSHFKNLD